MGQRAGTRAKGRWMRNGAGRSSWLEIAGEAAAWRLGSGHNIGAQMANRVRCGEVERPNLPRGGRR
jgi:hypothetical protein